MGVSLLYITRVASAFAEPRSLNEPVNADDGEDRVLGDTVVDECPLPDAAVDALYERDLVARGLRGIDRQSALVIALRFLASWSTREVAAVVGVGPTRVSQIERQAVQRMREAIAARARSRC